jgi:hypothetical protein
MAANPPEVEPISLDEARRLGVHRETHALCWDGAPVVTRSQVRLGNFERWMTGIIAAGTFGTFLVELWPLLVKLWLALRLWSWLTG